MRTQQVAVLGVLALIGVAACSHAPPAAAPTVAAAPPKVVLAVLPAESDQFPHTARAATDSMARVKIGGIDRTSVSKVSLEVVQLAIECTDPTATCYQAIGHSLAANRLLFAQIAPGGKGQVKVTVTLFDVDAMRATHTAEKTFTREDDATAGAAQLVAEATQP